MAHKLIITIPNGLRDFDLDEAAREIEEILAKRWFLAQGRTDEAYAIKMRFQGSRVLIDECRLSGGMHLEELREEKGE